MSGAERKKIEYPNLRELKLPSRYVEKALPILMPNKSSPDGPMHFAVQGSYTGAEVQTTFDDKIYKGDKHRTSWFFGKDGVFSKTAKIKTRALEEGTEQVPVKDFVIEPDGFFMSRSEDYKALSEKFKELTEQEAAALNVLIIRPKKGDILQQGHVGAMDSMVRTWLSFISLSLSLDLLPDPRGIKQYIIKKTDGSLFLKREVVLNRLKDPSDLEGSRVNVLKVSFQLKIEMQPDGGFSYHIDETSYSFKIEKAFWKELVEAGIQNLNELKSWDDRAIVSFVPLLQDAEFAVAFVEKLKVMPFLNQNQADLFADCYQRCFGSLFLLKNLSFWQQHKSKMAGFFLVLAVALGVALLIVFWPQTVVITAMIGGLEILAGSLVAAGLWALFMTAAKVDQRRLDDYTDLQEKLAALKLAPASVPSASPQDRPRAASDFETIPPARGRISIASSTDSAPSSNPSSQPPSPTSSGSESD